MTMQGWFRRGMKGAPAMVLLMSAACGGGSRTGEPAAMSPVPAESAAPALRPIPAHGAGVPDTAPAPAGELRWTTPDGWVAETPSSGMRRAQYRLPAARGDHEDGACVVYYFGAGQGGDVKPNLDRWASQFTGWGSNPPKVTEMKVGDLAVSRAEISGTYTSSPMSMDGGGASQPKADFMLLGAIVPGPEANWFFKCTGPGATMRANRAGFDALIASLHVGP